MSKEQTEKKETKTMPVKPLALVLEETKQEMFRLVNHAMQANGLPAYLLEPVVADLHNQLLLAKQQELSSAGATYEKQMAEFEKATKPEVSENDDCEENKA